MSIRCPGQGLDQPLNVLDASGDPTDTVGNTGRHAHPKGGGLDLRHSLGPLPLTGWKPTYRPVKLHRVPVRRDRHVLVAPLRLADPGHRANPAIIELGMAGNGVPCVDLLSELGHLCIAKFSFGSLIRREPVGLHVESREEPARVATEPDEDVVFDAEGLVRSLQKSDPHTSDVSFDAAVAVLDGPARGCLELRLLGSRALDRLSTRGRLSVNSEANLLEPQEVHERRDRLDKVGRWALVTALHEGGARGTTHEVQNCRNVHVPAAVQEEIVQLTRRDHRGRMSDSRVWPIRRFPRDARHAPRSDGASRCAS